MSRNFFTRKTETRGDKRELYFTKYSDIEKVVKDILLYKPELKSVKWIDPCSADGRWEEVIRKYGIECESYDIKPLNEKVKQKDFLSSESEKCFYIGNPPFSKLKEFVNKALEKNEYCYFLGGSMIITGTLSNKCEMIHRFDGYEGKQKDRRSKLKFYTTNNENILVWCCGALFTKKECEKLKRDNGFAVSPKVKSEEKRVRTIYE